MNGKIKCRNNWKSQFCIREVLKLSYKKLCLFFAIGMLLVGQTLITGCGKKVIPQVYTYEEQSDGTVMITGLTEKGKSDSKLIIPMELGDKKVTAIGREAFRDNTAVTTVEISDNVTSILENAFLGCTRLEEITFSSNLEDVGTNIVKNTLWEKKKLEEHTEIIVNNILIEVQVETDSYKIPDGVKNIASGVFYRNDSLKSISIPNTIEKIGSYAFAECENLTTLEIPIDVQEIGYDAFLNLAQVKYAGNAQGSPWGAKEILQ